MSKRNLLSLGKRLSINDLKKIDLLSVLVVDLNSIVAEYRTALYLDDVMRADQIESAINNVIDEIYKLRKD